MASREGRKVYRSKRWREVRAVVLHRAGWRCSKCGSVGRLEVHHVQRVVDGGDHYAMDNLRALCRDCHFAAHDGPRHCQQPRTAAGRMKEWALQDG